MDYIKQHKAFYSRLEYTSMSAGAIALWNALLYLANRTGWVEYFAVANKVLEAKSSLESSSFKRARNELVQKKFLIYEKGKNQSDAARYCLPVLYGPASEPANDPAEADNIPVGQYGPASEPANEPPSEPPSEPASGPIIKPKNLKPINQKRGAFAPPSVEEVAAYCAERGNGIDAGGFVAFYASKGWMVGKNKMADWKQAIITWEQRRKVEDTPNSQQKHQPQKSKFADYKGREWDYAALERMAAEKAKAEAGT